MQDGQGAQPKQLLSERIKNATNILVTVSRDPSVDELSAALGLTLMLNKLDKHATAVFSGKIPPAIEFLNPEKTFEGTVDSLRDFIIALDKDKADRLRYKVEDDVVRIFITPYRTIINEKDLAFSQGDFNVELIVAIGVENREDLDTAVTAHGRILHDAAVVTINTTNQTSDLGAIDWSDASASGYSEMLMSLSESLKSGLLDEQIATALLTGIVAATERFANDRTSPKVMTMAAQLMAAGANQQLIATKLEEGHALPPKQASAPDGSTHLKEGSSEKLSKEASEAPAEKQNDGEMVVEHEEPTNQEQALEKATELADEAEEEKQEHSEQTQKDESPKDESALDLPSLPKLPPTAPTLSVEDLKKDLASANQELEAAAAGPVLKGSGSVLPENDDVEPTFGGTLNATTDEAHDAKEREDRKNRNHTLLSHDEPIVPQAPLNSESPGARNDEPPSVDPFAEPPKSDPASPLHYEATGGNSKGVTLQPLPDAPSNNVAAPTADAPVAASTEPPTLAELEAQAHNAAAGVPADNSLNDARAAVSAALDSLPFNPANEPLAGTGAQPLSGPLHDPSPAASGAFPPPPVGTVSPDLPPLPDFSTLPPLPGDIPPSATDPMQTPPLSSSAPVAAPIAPAPAAAPPSNDPGQFKLPGQA